MGEPSAGAFTWETVAEGDEGPGPRSRHGLAYDREAAAAVLFGGAIWLGGGRARLPDDTWELRDGGWTLIGPTEGPCGRHRAAMVYDDARGVSVLFGGQGLRIPFHDDTWTYADRRWRRVRTWSWRRPPARCGHAMAYDEERRQVVLFGGIDARGDALGDTWVFNGSWRHVGRPGPSARRYSAFAYDPDLKGCVLHGGAFDDHGRLTYGDTWLFRDGDWSPLPGAFETDPRDDHGLAYHREARALVMLEGVGGARGVLVLSPSGWLPADAEPLHPRHQCSPLAWDDGLGGLLLHGGEVRHGGPQLDATLVLRA